MSQACIACAEVKLRCEGTEPCGRCQNKGLVCEYGRPRSEKATVSTEPNQTVEVVSEAPDVSLELDLPSTQRSQDLPRNDFDMEINRDDRGGQVWREQVSEQPQLPTPTTFDQRRTPSVCYL